MSWVEIIWSMTAGTCLTLAGVHVLVWLKARDAWLNLLFATSAVAVAVIAGFELTLMHSRSTTHFGTVQRWMHVPFWALPVSLVWFLRLYLRAGRVWLAWAFCGTRTLALALNFAFHPNLNFREITSLRQVPLLGEMVSVPIGITNRWTLVGQAASILLLVFVVDAAVTAWRRGDRRRALRMGGVMSVGIVVAAGQSALLVWGVIPMPYFLSLVFLTMVLIMGYELSQDLLRAAQLANQLQASEAGLRESEARLGLAAESADAGLWSLDLTTKLFWATERARAIFEFGPKEELPFNRLSELIHPDDRQLVRQAMECSVALHQDLRLDYRIVLPAGRTRWIASRGRPYYTASGQAQCLMGVSIDITDRKAAEETIQQSEEFNRTVLRSLRNLIAILDRNGTVLSVNSAWSQFALANERAPLLAGVDVGLSYLNACQQAVDAGDGAAGRALEGIHSVLEGRKATFEMEFSCSSVPPSIWFLMRVLPFMRPEGGVVVSYTDITRHKRVEETAAEQRRELNHLNRLSTMGELAASLAHELRQPLTGILSNAQAGELLLNHTPPDWSEMRAVLAGVISDTRRASEIIGQMRDFLRKRDAPRQPVDINVIVEEALRILRSEAILQGIKLLADLDPNLPRVMGDRVQLQQVLLNVIANAQQAMIRANSSERQLMIRTERNGESTAVLIVDDSGPGFESGTLEKVFLPFFTTRPEGIGMGLAICLSIIEAHRGRMSAEVRPEGGARIRIELPTVDRSGSRARNPGEQT
jgi:two-component system, LuxR family, sensor kinase FixL